MKALKLLTLALVLTVFTVTIGEAKNKPESPEERLRSKITNLVKNPDLKLIPIHEREVTLEFIVTRQNEILVIDVDTYNSVLETHIKEKLNYRQISVKGIRKMTPYRIDLAFVEKKFVNN